MSGNNNQKNQTDASHTIQKSENTMNKQTESTEDLFAVCARNFDKIRGDVEKTIPHYLQAFTSFQQEYLTTWNNFVHAAIAVQQQYATKLGINVQSPQSTTSAIDTITDQVIKVRNIQTKLIQTAFDASRQQIKTINDNVNVYTDLNQTITKTWSSIWKTQN